MSKLNFSDFYNQEESIDENFLTALSGKIGTAAMNIFRKTTKHISIAPDFLKIFKELSLPKYDKTLDKLATDFNNKTKWKNIYIKDIRIGDIAGKSNIISMITKSNEKVPGTDDPLWKAKEHSPAVTVYLLSNGGAISLWNLPTTDNDPEEQFNANKRAYAIGMNSAAEKAFMLMFGMGYKDWLTRQQVADNTSIAKTGADKAKEDLTVKGFEISDDVYNKLVPESISYISGLKRMNEIMATPTPAAPVANQTQTANATTGDETETPPDTHTNPVKQPAGSLAQLLVSKLKAKVTPFDQEGKKGFIYDLGQKGRLYVYKNKEGKAKLAYTKGLEDTLVANKIIAKPTDIPKLESFTDFSNKE